MPLGIIHQLVLLAARVVMILGMMGWNHRADKVEPTRRVGQRLW